MPGARLREQRGRAGYLSPGNQARAVDADLPGVKDIAHDVLGSPA